MPVAEERSFAEPRRCASSRSRRRRLLGSVTVFFGAWRLFRAAPEQFPVVLLFEYLQWA